MIRWEILVAAGIVLNDIDASFQDTAADSPLPTTLGSGTGCADELEWLEESFFSNGSIASATIVQPMPAKPSLLKRLV